jgi:hypothetical protein
MSSFGRGALGSASTAAAPSTAVTARAAQISQTPLCDSLLQLDSSRRAQACTTTLRVTVTATPFRGVSVIFTLSARQRRRLRACCARGVSWTEKESLPADTRARSRRPTRTAPERRVAPRRPSDGATDGCPFCAKVRRSAPASGARDSSITQQALTLGRLPRGAGVSALSLARLSGTDCDPVPIRALRARKRPA